MLECIHIQTGADGQKWAEMGKHCQKSIEQAECGKSSTWQTKNLQTIKDIQKYIRVRVGLQGT